MLKKLFNGSQPNNNNSSNSSNASLTDARTCGLEKDEWDERTGYATSVAQLDHFEGRLQEVLRALTRHCQAITDMSASTNAFSDHFRHLLADPTRASSVCPAKYPSDKALGLISMFRVSAIAPLQSLLILVPQLRVRCEHRKSAMQLMLRYQRKVLDMERAAKTKIESSRLQRNRAKLQAATARFRDLDNHVQQEIRIIVSNDIASIVERPTRELLLRAQLLTGEFAVDSAIQFQSPAAALPNQVRAKADHAAREEGAVSSNKQGLQQQQASTPMRRMAMTVLPLVAEDNNNSDGHCYVRQSILAPPVHLQLSAADTRMPLRQPSSTASEDDQSVGGELNEEASGYETVAADIHEDYGIGKRKKHVHGTRTWDIHQHIKDNMSTGLDLVDCVRLPDGFARDEWIAVHVVDFFNEINLLYGTISEFCTPDACPRMSAGPCYAYTWTDSATNTRSTTHNTNASHLPASQYVARLMDWIEHQINDPRVFPSNATTYQPDFEQQVARVVLKRLFRVYAHMYHSHLENFAELSADVHLGFCFKRFVCFVTEFELVEQKELNALRKLVDSVLDNPVDALVLGGGYDDDDDDKPEVLCKM